MCSNVIPEDEWVFFPMPQSFSTISVYIANNKACTGNADDYFIFDLYTKSLLFCVKSSYGCSVSTSPSLPMSPIEVQIWGRHSTTLLDGIGYVVNITSSTILPPPPSHRWRITGTVQPKLRRENANKRWINGKYESLLLNALIFFSHVWEGF